MNEYPESRCTVCGRLAKVFSTVPGAGEVCEECLLAGRFLGSTGAPRFLEAAKSLSRLSPQTVSSYANPLLSEVQRLIESGHLDRARQVLMDNATKRIDEGMPLLAAFFLNGALAIQGYSGAVYACLGDAAVAAGSVDDAKQHYKTAGWLAMQLGDRVVVERAIAGLKKVKPDDTWIGKAKAWLGGEHHEGEALCGFCGKAESEVGPLIQGPNATICSQCLSRLSKLQH